MTAKELLNVMQQASDFPQGMEKLIKQYGEMLVEEEIMHFLQTVKLSDIMYKTREELLDIYLKGKQL